MAGQKLVQVFLLLKSRLVRVPKTALTQTEANNIFPIIKMMDWPDPLVTFTAKPKKATMKKRI